jgi:hypothetical protein
MSEAFPPPPFNTGDRMSKQDRVRIELTEAQKKQIKDASGEDVSAIEFTVQELEQRISPLLPAV